MGAQARTGACALLADGTTIEIRPARPGDFAAVRDMHAKMSPQNLYRRLLGTSQLAAEKEARRICREPGPGRAALVAVLAGLRVAILAEDTQRALRDLLPSAAAVAGPVDTTAGVAPGLFRRCLELVGADPGIDAVLAVTATTAASDLVSEVRAARLALPAAASVRDQIAAVRLLPGPDESSPAVPHGMRLKASVRRLLIRGVRVLF